MVENTKVSKTITSNSNRNFNRVLELKFFFNGNTICKSLSLKPNKQSPN